MKSLLLIGGILGFGIGLLFSWAQASEWPACLWHACLAAYLTALLMRWWGTAWRKNLEAALQERQSMATQAAPSPLLKATKS
ncbi:MAG: hypothetical protein JWQ04_2445 [Pedosphaera sp.]|nr:hypothetical protein [Pedosphaera sp.]